MKHECEPDWKQLGTLASGVLRSVMEKRMKHAEFLTAEKGPYEAPREYSQSDARIQLTLPLGAESTPQVYTGARRV